ncbi:hypothetical protein E3Q24_04475 [Wallemia mellicola]|nr:hypothetical protein E3Q24_04475 [Wallemia mellicola]
MPEPRDPLLKVLLKLSFSPYGLRALITNDPSAGSPTETLLRLLLPLNDQVCPTLQSKRAVAGSNGPLRRAH